MNVGERIRQLRIHKKLTQGELVKDISSITYLSRIENGQIKPSYSFLKKISKRLTIPLDDLAEQNTVDAEKRISTIFDDFKRDSQLSEEELSFLSMNTKESHPPHILIQLYGILIRYFVHKDINQAETLYTLSSRVIPNNDDNTDIDTDYYLFYYISCGIYYYKKQLYDRSDHYFTKAERIMDHKDTLENGKLYYNISLVKQRLMEDKTLGLYYSKNAYDIFEKYGETRMMAMVLITQGVQYHLMKEYDQSLTCLNHAMNLVEDTNESLLAMIEYNKGRVYQGLHKFEEAIDSYQKSININEKLNIIEEQIYSLRSLAEVFIEKKHWDEVEKSLVKAFDIAEEYEMNYMYIELGWMRAYTYKVRGDDFTYEKDMRKFIENGVKLNQQVLVKKMAKELGNYFYEIRAYKKAADHMKLAMDMEG
ncbi:tetratricopeptide repeat protein [Halobacillus sp. MO56]